MNFWFGLIIVFLIIIALGILMFYFLYKILPKIISLWLRILVGIIGVVIVVLALTATATTGGIASIGAVPLVILGTSMVVLAAMGPKIFKNFVDTIKGVFKK